MEVMTIVVKCPYFEGVHKAVPHDNAWDTKSPEFS